jgi:hypothetical protein
MHRSIVFVIVPLIWANRILITDKTTEEMPEPSRFFELLGYSTPKPRITR